jgi:regulator of sigma E protease
MLAVISISVGIFNLLPIPLLDGGHLLQYIIESIRQRDFSLIEIKISQTIGIFSIMLIFSISIVNDLLKMVHF